VTTSDVVVIALGVAAVVWVNWYFFLAGRREVAVSAPAGSGPQRVHIVVSGGYEPSVIRVRAGRPVRLEFDRRETSGCTEEVVLPDFGVRTFLPPHETTPIEVTPPRPGTYEFTCGMSMVRGKIVAVEGGNS
jgi:plastocyanin domain-containing protein